MAFRCKIIPLDIWKETLCSQLWKQINYIRQICCIIVVCILHRKGNVIFVPCSLKGLNDSAIININLRIYDAIFVREFYFATFIKLNVLCMKNCNFVIKLVLYYRNYIVSIHRRDNNKRCDDLSRFY